MGQDGALPRRFFGTLNPVRRIPQNNVPLIGAIVLIASLAMSYQLGTELLNYGALLAFMGVNVASAVLAWHTKGLKPVAAHSAFAFWLRSVFLPVAKSRPNRTMGGDCLGSSGNRFVASPPKSNGRR